MVVLHGKWFRNGCNISSIQTKGSVFFSALLLNLYLIISVTSTSSSSTHYITASHFKFISDLVLTFLAEQTNQLAINEFLTGRYLIWIFITRFCMKTVFYASTFLHQIHYCHSTSHCHGSKVILTLHSMRTRKRIRKIQINYKQNNYCDQKVSHFSDTIDPNTSKIIE